MCRLAKSQNGKPVVFLDGDKRADLKKVNESHPDVSVILLQDGTEFEEVLPRAKYIEAAAAVLEDANRTLCDSAFLEWEAAAELRPSIMFSKRVERCTSDEFDKPHYKPLVMRKAIELTDVAEIKAEPFKQLLEAMKQVANTL